MLLIGGSIALLTLGGCSAPERRTVGVEVLIEGNGTFPEALGGHWQSDKHGWEFDLAPDGQILSAVISLGRVRVVPGRVTTVPTRSADTGVFAPGLWTVHYDPQARQLTIRITMDHVRIAMAGNVVEGTSTDVFAGPIDPVEGLWQAQWTTFTRYAARTPEAPPVGLSTDPTYGETTPLLFRRAARP